MKTQTVMIQAGRARAEECRVFMVFFSNVLQNLICLEAPVRLVTHTCMLYVRVCVSIPCMIGHFGLVYHNSVINLDYPVSWDMLMALNGRLNTPVNLQNSFLSTGP